MARGSHANYFGPGRYARPVGWDEAAGGDAGVALGPASPSGGYMLTLLTDQPWLAFAGRWGERCLCVACDGPTGPAFKGLRWDHAARWAAALPSDCWQADADGLLHWAAHAACE